MSSKTSSTLHWAHAAVLLAKLQFGLGILGVPATFHTLGMLFGLLSLLALTGLVLYSGIQLVPFRARHPHLADVGDVADVLFQHNRIAVGVFGAAYGLFLVLIVAAGLLTTSMALNAITSHATCTLVFVGAAAAFVLLIGAPLHQLHRISWLGWLGMTCILLSVWTLVIALLVVGHPFDATINTVVQRPPLLGRASLVDTSNAISVQATCLMGNVAFHAVYAEMRHPHLFKRALVVGQTGVLLNYVVVSIAVSSVAGQFIRSPVLRTAGPTIERICFAMALPGLLVSTLLFANMAPKYLYQRIVRRQRGDGWPPTQRWLVWTCVYAAVVMLGALTAVAIPIFDQLLGLTGAALGPLYLLILTGLMGLYLLSSPKDNTHWMASTWLVVRTSKRAAFSGALHIAMVILGIAMTVVGVYASVTLIAHDYSHSHGAAFSCANNLPL